jgi:hypothetical protein
MTYSKLLLHCFSLAIVATPLLSTSGCAKARLAMASSLIDDVAIAANKSDDTALVEQAAPTFILLLEGLLEKNPDNRRLLIGAAQSYTSYAALIEIEDPERARRLYKRGKTHSLAALSCNERVAPLLSAPFAEFLSVPSLLKEKDLPSVFWTASSWGAWISTNTGSMAALADLPRVILLMEWVLEQDEAYFYGSPHVFLGVYHAALPPTLGGNPEKSLAHFRRAEELTEGRSLIVHAQMARFYARQIFDRDLYESLLHKVLSAPTEDEAGSELTLQNELARNMARQLLLETDDFF